MHVLSVSLLSVESLLGAILMKKITDYEALIRHHEGTRAKPYTDTVGKVTVGVGRNLTDVPLDRDEIDYLYDRDLRRALRVCRDIAPNLWEFTDVRQAVLLDMAYNLRYKMRGFTKFRDALKDRDFARAAKEMLDSRWAEQVGKKPRQRAWRLARMMERNEWPTV